MANVRVRSSHYPIFLLADPISTKRNFSLLFWENVDFTPYTRNIIKEWWKIKVEGNAMIRVAKKLWNIKDNIKRWNIDTFGNIFKRKNENPWGIEGHVGHHSN